MWFLFDFVFPFTRDEFLPFLGCLIYAVTMFKLFDNYTRIREESERNKIEMDQKLNDLMHRYDEDLQLERKKSSSFFLKMRMQHRDCMAKVGGAHRKLREKNGLLVQLKEKVTSLEWVEEDAHEMMEELEKARKKIGEQEKTIEELKKKYESAIQDLESRMKVADQFEDNKENVSVS